MTSRSTLERRIGLASVAYALAIAVLGTPLPTPLYGLYSERVGLSELMITVIFATYAAGITLVIALHDRQSPILPCAPAARIGLT